MRAPNANEITGLIQKEIQIWHESWGGVQSMLLLLTKSAGLNR